MNKDERDEIRLRYFIGCSGLGTWEWNVQTGETVFNDIWAQIIGYTLEELAPVSVKTWETLAHPDDLKASDEALGRHFAGELPYYDIECRMKHKDGHWVWVHDRGKVVSWTADGEPLMMFGTHSDITERKRAEEELARIFSMSLDMICIANIKTATFIKVNPAFTEILGHSEEALLDKPFLDFVHPDDIDATNTIIEQKLKSGVKVINFENRYRCKDGSYRWLSWVSHPKPEQDITYAVARDITQWKRSEEELRASEARYRRLSENSPDMIYRMSLPDGKYEYVSPAAEIIFGYPPQVWYETPLIIREIIHPDSHSYFKVQWEQLLKGQVPPTYEYQIVHKNGEVRWINQRNVAVRGSEGNLLAIEGIVTDITDRKKAEEALVRKDAMLANIASQVPGMLYQFMMRPDGSFCVPYSSQGVEELFGCTPEQVRDDFDPIFKAIYPDDRDKILQTIQVSVKNLSQWMCEYRVQLPGQPVKWIFGNSIPEKRPDGAIVWSGYNMDITERMNAEEEKARLQAHLQQAQKIESVGRLAGGVAHDFNNMLGVILGYAELAQAKVDPFDSLHADLTEIITAAQRSAKITRQLLAFARKQTVAPVVLDLNIIVAGMHKMLQRLIGEQIELSWHPAVDLWPVKLDASQIEQILANLCVNARDAISDGGKITIETGNCVFDAQYCVSRTDFKPGEFVRLAVSDNGCGMDQDTLAHIFEPFFTTKGVGEGTGLGLAMIYGAVKQHDGFIDVRSALGQGTTLSIYLPRYIGEDAPAHTGTATEAVRGGRETILLVEDESAVLAMTQKALERLGYSVLAAGTIQDAIGLARMHPGPIHLLMTDVVMPEMNGPALYKKIYALRPGIKCLYMSGYTASALGHHDQIDAGIHFLQKPFSRQDLAVKLRVALSDASSAT